jgi:6-phosphogluconolactonase (cycloisomerase 2 family)
VTVHDGIGYVLNQDSDTIAGFTYDGHGDLEPLTDSTRSLTLNPSGGITDAAQVSFSPDGHSLVVTQKATNVIDIFAVHKGYAGEAAPHASAGVVPYGFDFDKQGRAYVSEAATGSVSSYRVTGGGLTTLSAAVPDEQAAACWLVVGNDSRTVYAVNAASRSISTYRITGNGQLELLDAVAATTTTGPTDATLSPDGRSLHVRLAIGTVASYAVNADGSLDSTGTTRGAAAFGIAGLASD